MKPKMVIAALLAVGTAVIVISAASAASFDGEPAPDPREVMLQSGDLWHSESARTPAGEDMTLIEQFDGKDLGRFVDAGILLKPAGGARIAVQTMTSGTLCVQANDGPRPVVAWCGTTFEDNGLAYAYNTGNVPGLRSSLVGLALPQVREIQIETTAGRTAVDVVEGSFWWKGEPGELIRSMTVTNGDRKFVERMRFVPPEKDTAVYPIAVD
jgi:hypothetical protein